MSIASKGETGYNLFGYKTAGLDKAKFDKALADSSAKNQVNYNTELSRKAGVTGTPMIYANNQAIPGAIPLDALKQVLAN